MIFGSVNSSASGSSISSTGSATGGLRDREDSVTYQNVQEQTSSASTVVTLSAGAVVAPVTPDNQAFNDQNSAAKEQQQKNSAQLLNQSSSSQSSSFGQAPLPEPSELVQSNAAPAISPASTQPASAPSATPEAQPSTQQVVNQQEQAAIANQIRELKQRDAEVRQHEQAHAIRGGVHAGAPTYTFTTGPDGVRYATGGEVSIDISAEPGDPEATLDKARDVRAAALAPQNPSPQDRRVAAEASQLAIQAQVDLLKLKQSAEQAAQESENAPEPIVNDPSASPREPQRRVPAEDAASSSTSPASEEVGDIDADAETGSATQTEEDRKQAEADRQARREELAQAQERSQNQSNALERYQEIFGSFNQDSSAIASSAANQQVVSDYLSALS